MPFLSIVRFLATLVSLGLLGLTAYLLWVWYDGDLVRQANGDLVRVREDWRIWTAIGLGLFSFLGKFLAVPLLARPDAGEPSLPERGAGQIVEQPGGSQIYVEETGLQSGPTLILTHGWALDSTIWHYARQSLHKSFRIIVWDLPGLGRSKGRISLESFAAELGSIILRSGADKVVLVGHSIGGMTIQTLARDRPELFLERVAGAVLLNTTYTNPLKTMILSGLAQAIRWPLLEPLMRLTILLQPLAWLSAWLSYLSGTAHIANRLGFGKYVTRSQLDHVTLLATRNPPGEVQKGNLAMFRWNATGALRDIDVPILVIAGEADIVTRPDASRELARQTPRAQIEVIEGVNHMGMLERADLYNSAVSAFAERVLPRSA